MAKNQSTFRSRTVRHWLRGSTALGACALAVGCAAGADGTDPFAAGGESVAQTEELLDTAPYCPNPVACNTVTSLKALTDTSGSTGQITKVAKDVINALADVYQHKYFSAGGDLFSAYSDATSSNPDIYLGISCLNSEVACVAQGLDWQIKAGDWWHQYNLVAKALMDIPTGFGANSPDDSDSHAAVMDSGAPNMFARTYIASSTDGDGKWKGIVSNNAPPLVGPNNVYDWEAGFTRYMSLIPRRVAILGYMDPLFASDGTRNLELEGVGDDPFKDSQPGYRHTLQQRLKQMLDGVRCTTVDRVAKYPNGTVLGGLTYAQTDIACADVNTGISAETKYVIPNYASCFSTSSSGTQPNNTCIARLPGQYQVAALKDSMLRQVLSKMPIFEVNSMIDSLRRLTHPWVPDLTQASSQIPLAANHGLCLDLPAANATSGTALQIWGCNGTAAQWWSYNRKTGTITETAVGKCMQVRPNSGVDNRSQGAVVEISDCINPPPLRQQWTFDPEHGAIRSALGTVIEIPANNQTAGTPIKTADYNGGASQLWYSDRGDGSYCTTLCDPMCKASCVNAGPGTGSCVGGCMGGCYSSCPGRTP